MANLANSFDYSNVTIYSSSSAKAILYGIQGKFSGEDSDGNKIKPSGTGKNEGKFLLKDVRKCPNVQEWIKKENIEGEKEEKKVNKFSSKAAEKLLKKSFLHWM